MTIREWRQKAAQQRDQDHFEALRLDEQFNEHARMAKDPFSRIERRQRFEMRQERTDEQTQEGK